MHTLQLSSCCTCLPGNVHAHDSALYLQQSLELPPAHLQHFPVAYSQLLLRLSSATMQCNAVDSHVAVISAYAVHRDPNVSLATGPKT